MASTSSTGMAPGPPALKAMTGLVYVSDELPGAAPAPHLLSNGGC